MHDPRDYPMPDPKTTLWLTSAVRILAIAVTTDLPVIRPDGDRPDNDAPDEDRQ